MAAPSQLSGTPVMSVFPVDGSSGWTVDQSQTKVTFLLTHYYQIVHHKKCVIPGKDYIITNVMTRLNTTNTSNLISPKYTVACFIRNQYICTTCKHLTFCVHVFFSLEYIIGLRAKLSSFSDLTDTGNVQIVLQQVRNQDKHLYKMWC